MLSEQEIREIKVNLSKFSDTYPSAKKLIVDIGLVNFSSTVNGSNISTLTMAIHKLWKLLYREYSLDTLRLEIEVSGVRTTLADLVYQVVQAYSYKKFNLDIKASRKNGSSEIHCPISLKDLTPETPIIFLNGNPLSQDALLEYYLLKFDSNKFVRTNPLEGGGPIPLKVLENILSDAEGVLKKGKMKVNDRCFSIKEKRRCRAPQSLFQAQYRFFQIGFSRFQRKAPQ